VTAFAERDGPHGSLRDGERDASMAALRSAAVEAARAAGRVIRGSFGRESRWIGPFRMT